MNKYLIMNLTELLEANVVTFPTPKYMQELVKLLNTKVDPKSTSFYKLWDDLENFILDEKNPSSFRIKALKKMDQMTGETHSSYTAKDVEEYVKTTNQEKRSMYESNELFEDLTPHGKERVERAASIFAHIMQDTPDINVEHAKKAAIKMAHIEIHNGHEISKAEEEFKKVLAGKK